MIASVPPAAVAISFVVVPSNPFREKKSRAVSSNCRRRSLAGNRCVERRESFTSPIVSQYLLTVKAGILFGFAPPRHRLNLHYSQARYPVEVAQVARPNRIAEFKRGRSDDEIAKRKIDPLGRLLAANPSDDLSRHFGYWMHRHRA